MKFEGLPIDTSLNVRFLRYEDDLRVPDDWEGYVTHSDLLAELRLTYPTIDNELHANPGKFDAGFLYRLRIFPNEISIARDSATLKLPAREHVQVARFNTARLVQSICPRLKVDSRTD